jgi:hypothetical protein
VTAATASKPASKSLEKAQPDFSFDLIQSFSVQKAGNAIAECEDIWDYAQRDRRLLIALSDGATESSFSQQWAKELVSAFVNCDLLVNDSIDWLAPLQKKWQKWLADQNLSWFAKRKAGEGAFATFLSLEIFDDLSWKALAVGDSCLFVVRQSPITNYQSPITNHQLQKSFPLQSSHAFNNRPRLIGTHIEAAKISTFKTNGKAQVGDRFYLMTDAIACWVFQQLEANQDPWLKLEQLSSQDLFVKWVSELRDRREIANDDTTLLCLEIGCQP